jgi:hypothetical protein
MENPATWGKAERTIAAAKERWAAARNEGIVGLSLARTIADALRAEGLLVEEKPSLTEQYQGKHGRLAQR